jgi:transposase
MTVYIGVDFHPHQETVCYCDSADGVICWQTLWHGERNEVRAFYEQFEGEVIIGLDAGGPSQWFEEMIEGLSYKLHYGDSSEIRRRARSRHKNDKRDAELLLELLIRDEFPSLWRRSAENERVLGQIRFRHRLVQQRTRVCNQLQALGHGAGLPKQKVRTDVARKRLEEVELDGSRSIQRRHWFEMLDDLNARISEVEQWLTKRVGECPQARLLITQPGVGVLTALCIAHTLGDVSRFSGSRKVVAYVGLDPLEDSSGDRKRFGRISKAGSRQLRFLLGQAGQASIKSDLEMKQFYQQLSQRRGKSTAKVAVARKILVRSFIILRDRIDYEEFRRRGRRSQCVRVAQ